MNVLLHISLIILLFSCKVFAQSDIHPDFYDQAGIDPNREVTEDYPEEVIDPFTGGLNVVHKDVVIPGNGGLDLVIARVYRNLQDRESLYERSPVGLGWVMHLGRVIQPNTSTKIEGSTSPQGGGPVCVTNLNTTADNPTLQLSDGSSQQLVMHTSNNYWITRDRWRGECDPVNGWEIWSPQGIKYELDEFDAGTVVGAKTWYVTRISDPFGNWININYFTNGVNRIFPDNINTSDGRDVNFIYTNRTNINTRLTSINAEGKTWSYTAVNFPGLSGYLRLDRVTRPGGQFWDYDYNGSAGLGRYCLESMRYPLGATVSYDYEHHNFDSSTSLQSTVIDRKTINGASVSGTWSYSYTRAGGFDRTTVSMPLGRSMRFEHYGFDSVSNGTVWRIGLLRSARISGSATQTTTYTWGSQQISNEPYVSGFRNSKSDNDTFAPQVTQKVIVRDGDTYTTTYSGFDSHGNATNINENGPGGGARNTSRTFFINTTHWIISRVKNENISGNNNITRTYNNSNGFLTNENRFGQNFLYTPTSNGDIASIRDPRGNTTTFSSYRRGVPGTIDPPASGSTVRTIDNFSRILSSRDARSNTTIFGYDTVGRLSLVNPPAGSSINISWSGNTRTLTRGSYNEVMVVDGLGRPISFSQEGFDFDFDYDIYGNKTFKSEADTSAGTDFTYDALDRLTRIDHPDGSSKNYNHSGNAVIVTNERNRNTTYTYESYGNPDEQYLASIATPEGTTSISRNQIGIATSVSQGGTSRTLGRNGVCLSSMSLPEVGGNITYGPDGNCNRRSVSISGQSAVTYTYNSDNRLTNINFPDSARDVTITPDDNGNVTSVNNGFSDVDYDYNANNVLEREDLSVNGRSFAIAYSINSLDHVTSMTYPSGMQVSYGPNALGRPQQATPFVSSVGYHNTGAIGSMTYSNGSSVTMGQEDFGLVGDIRVTSGSTLLNLNYVYDNRGNVTSIIDNLDSSFSVTGITYDGIDRIRTANGYWGNGSFTYNSKGDMQTKTVGSSTWSYNYSSGGRLNSISSGGSTIYNFNYDGRGNVTDDGFNELDFDSDNKVISLNSGQIDYNYDGNGRRVRSTSSDGLVKYFFYTQSGLLAGEYNSDGDPVKEYVYLNGKMVGQAVYVPDKPSSITAPAYDANGSFNVDWSSVVEDLERYELWEDDIENGGETLAYNDSQSNYSVTGKDDGTYRYRVRACNADLCSEFQLAANNTVVAAAPAAPASITVPQVVSSLPFDVLWQQPGSGMVSYYVLEEATLANFSDSVEIYRGDEISFSVDGRDDGFYYYRVKACNRVDQACSNYLTASNSVEVDLRPDVPAQVVAPSYDQDGSFQVSWSVAGGVPDRYELWVEDIENSQDSLVYDGPDINHSLSNVLEGAYEYRVRACATLCSDFRYAQNITVVAQAPGEPASIDVPTIIYSLPYSIDWLPPSSGTVTYYVLEEAMWADFSDAIELYRGTDLSFTIFNQLEGVFYYRLKACNRIDQACSNYISTETEIIFPVPPDPVISVFVSLEGDPFEGEDVVSWGVPSGATEYIVEKTTRELNECGVPQEPDFSNASIVYQGEGAAGSGGNQLSISLSGSGFNSLVCYRVISCSDMNQPLTCNDNGAYDCTPYNGLPSCP